MELWQILLPARSLTNNTELPREPELTHQIMPTIVATLPLFSTDNKEHPCVRLVSVSRSTLILLCVGLSSLCYYP